MSLKEAIEAIFENVGKKLMESFTGKITLTFHCRNGGIGSLSMHTEQNLSVNRSNVINDHDKKQAVCN